MTSTSSVRHRSRWTAALGSCTFIALILAACYGGGYTVGTAYGPYWYPAGYGTFSVINYPWWGDPPNDPMHENSTMHRALAEEVRKGFAARGYRHLPEGGDVDVLVYANPKSGELDISGYTQNYKWKNLPALEKQTKFPEGTVIVDVLAPKTHELLWRGKSVAPVSSNSEQFQANLRTAVDKIIAKYPRATH